MCVCTVYMCVYIRQDKVGSVIKDNTNYFQPLKVKKTILGRSNRPFFDLK